MKELLMSKPNGDESNIIRADITVGYYNNEPALYGYLNTDTVHFGQCSNSKITRLYSDSADPSKSATLLELTTPMVASNVTITRLDTMYSISASDVDTTKNMVIINGSLFTPQDLDKTIPIEIRFA